MTSIEKDELIKAIIAGHTPGRNSSLSDFIAVDKGVGMGEAIEVILELKQRGWVEKYQRMAEDVRFSINSGLETFAKRGGFEAEDVVFQAELQKVFFEISKLKGELQPRFYSKIMKILEPLAPFAGIALETFL